LNVQYPRRRFILSLHHWELPVGCGKCLLKQLKL
jgi:hypothetical protein